MPLFRNWRRALSLLGLSLAAASPLAPWLTSPASARVGGRCPPFSLPAATGGPSTSEFRMADHLGQRPVVILFWATWCVPCQQELPFYQSLYTRHRDRGLKVCAISMDDANTLPSSGPMARRLGLEFPVVSDLDTAVTTRLNPRRAAPFSIWVDRSGRIVREREGFSLAERTEIVRGIVRLVRSRPASGAGN